MEQQEKGALEQPAGRGRGVGLSQDVHYLILSQREPLMPWLPPWVSPLGSWSRENEDADNNSSQSVASPPQAEQLNNQTSSLLEYPVYLQNQLSAKITTEARFEPAQPSSAIPQVDPTLSLQPSE